MIKVLWISFTQLGISSLLPPLQLKIFQRLVQCCQQMTWQFLRTAYSSELCKIQYENLVQEKKMIDFQKLNFSFLFLNRDGTKGEQVSQNGLPSDQESPRVSYRSQTYQNYKNFISRRTANDRSWSGL